MNRAGPHARGLASVVALYAILALLVMVIGGLVIGQVARRREAQQTQADALALASAAVARRHGPAAVCGHPVREELIQRNGVAPVRTDCPEPQRIPAPGGGTRLRYRVAVDSDYQSPFPFVPVEAPVHAAAAAEIIEYGPDPHRPAPRFVLLLDTSGSMADPLGPRDRTPRLDALRQALADLFDLPVDVDHGAVLYDGALRRVIPPARGAERAIEAALAAIEPGERTNFARPLEEAIFLLPDAHDVPSFALLLSDGLHNEGGDPAPVASRLRAGGVTLFTLYIGDPEARDPLSLRGRANLHRLAGPARGAPSPDHAYTVGDARSLGAALRDVTERIACGLGPLEPPPAVHLPLEAVRVWLRDPSGDETPLTFSFDVARDPAALTYTFVREGNRVELSRRACAEIIDRGATPIARYGDPVLVE